MVLTSALATTVACDAPAKFDSQFVQDDEFAEDSKVLASFVERVAAATVADMQAGLGDELQTFMTQSIEKSEAFASTAYAAIAVAMEKNPNGAFTERFIEQVKTYGKGLAVSGTVLEMKGPTVEGENFNLAELKGKVVVVDVFATWCTSCVTAHTEIKGLYEQYHEAGLEVVAVSADQEPAQLDAYVAKHKDPWVTFYDRKNPGNEAFLEKNVIKSYPTVMVVGRDGKVATVTGAGRIREVVAAEMAKPVVVGEYTQK